MRDPDRPFKARSFHALVWHQWQDEIIRVLPPDAAARRIGRPLPDVVERIRRLSKRRLRLAPR